jgi:DNA excision repair protein ERCC-5
MNKQGVLDPFFERGSNGTISAARKRDGYASKRLRQVVADFRKQKTKEQGEGSQGSDDETQNPPATRGKKTSGKKRGGKTSGRGRGRGRKRAATTTSKGSDEDAIFEAEVVEDASGTSTVPARTLRPKPKKRKIVTEVEPDEGGSSD